MLTILHHLTLIIKKNNFLVLGEGPIEGINDSDGAANQIFNIKFSKAKTKFYLNLHYNGANS